MATRVWKSVFGAREDLEKKLQSLSTEEKSVQSRIKRRARSSRQLARHVIRTSILIEILVVIYAIVMGRDPDLSWQIRSLRVLPAFAVPTLAALIYFIFTNIRKILEEKDKNRLEWLREERRTKINELKEKSNYYATQILIQRYDLDPAEKAAAASVLASKLGTESGLKLSIGDQSDGATSSHRKSAEIFDSDNDEEKEEINQKEDLEKFKVSSGNNDGWFGQIAALLVGEHPSQCFALICSKCFNHNGLARKEDLPFIRYYCRHCRALNGSEIETPVSAVNVSALTESAVTVSEITESAFTVSALTESGVTVSEINEEPAGSSSVVLEEVNERNTEEEEEKEVSHRGDI